MAKLPNYKLDLSKIEILLKQKFEKVQNASEDNFAALTADGNFKDSGKKASSFLANAAKVITKFYLGSDIAGRNLEQDTDGSLKLKENISVSSVISASISTNSLSTSNISGIDADDIPEGTVNKFYTDAKARAAISSTATGISYSGSSGVISLTSNYVIPTTTEKANYDTAYANNHLHGNKSNLDSVNQNLGTSSSPSFANLTTTSDITVNKTASSASAILSLKAKQDYSSVIRLYENTGSDVLRGQLAYRADLNATELRNPQTDGGVISLPDTGMITLDGGGTNGQVYISKGNLKIGNELGGVLKATTGTVSGSATTSDLPDSTDKRYCTEAQKTIISNTSGVNTGDETASTIKTKLGTASSSTDGYLTSSDWNTFNNKEPAISKNTAFNKNYETSTANIKMAGTASVGTTDTIAKADHVHPSDTSKLSLTGGTITGELNAFSRLQQTVVLQRLKSIVTSPSNIKRVIFFDETGATATLKDRSTNLSNAALSANASMLSSNVEGNCRTLNTRAGGNGSIWSTGITIANGKLFYGICELSNGDWLATEATDGYVYKSSNKGLNWTQLALIESGTGLREIIELANGSILVASYATNKIYKSIDNGTTWDSGTVLEAGTGLFGIVQLANGDILASKYAATGKIYKSTDNGTTWGSGTTCGAYIRGITQLSNGNVLVCGLDSNKLYKSTDNGATWDSGLDLTAFGIYNPSSIKQLINGNIIISCAVSVGGNRFYTSLSTDNGVTFISPIAYGGSSALNQFLLSSEKILGIVAGTSMYTSLSYFEFMDSDDLSFGDGSNDNPFSIIALINPNSVNGNHILTKYDLTTGSEKREWAFYFEASTYKLMTVLNDNSSGGLLQRYYNTALTSDIGTWHTYAMTYNGNSTYSGINLYRDGTTLTCVGTVSGAYTAMENLTAKAGNYRISTTGVKQYTGNSKYGFIAVIAEELSAAQAKEIDSLLRSYIGSDAAYL